MKARFKSIVLSALGTIAIFSAVTYSSCDNDKCKAIVCAYGGVCSEGTCLCPSGYEGPQCETITRTRYLGTWIVSEDGTLTNAAQYPISVEMGANITELSIKNFRNLPLSTPVSAFVKDDTMYINDQTIDGNHFLGVGYLQFDKFHGEHGKLVVRYKVIDGAGHIDDFGLDGGDPSLWNK
jgi:hypothetical protein